MGTGVAIGEALVAGGVGPLIAGVCVPPPPVGTGLAVGIVVPTTELAGCLTPGAGVGDGTSGEASPVTLPHAETKSKMQAMSKPANVFFQHTH